MERGWRADRVIGIFIWIKVSVLWHTWIRNLASISDSVFDMDYMYKNIDQCEFTYTNLIKLNVDMNILLPTKIILVLSDVQCSQLHLLKLLSFLNILGNGIQKGYCFLCVLLLYTAFLLNAFINIKRFLVEPLGTSMYRVMNKDWISPLPAHFPLVLFLCLIYPVKLGRREKIALSYSWFLGEMLYDFFFILIDIERG